MTNELTSTNYGRPSAHSSRQGTHYQVGLTTSAVKYPALDISAPRLRAGGFATPEEQVRQEQVLKLEAWCDARFENK